MRIVNRKVAIAASLVIGSVMGMHRVNAGVIAPKDLLVYQQGTATQAAAAASTPILIQEINPALTLQTTPVQSFNISTQNAPLFTSNEGSDGDMTLSNNGLQVTFSGWTASNGTAAENLVASRGAGAIDFNGVYTQPTTYTGSATAGNQTRSAYSPDGTNYYFGDKGGIFVQGGSTPLTGGPANVRPIKAFGANTYVLQAQAGTPLVATLTPSSPSAGQTSVTVTPLPGTLGATDTNAVDFFLLSSGNNSVFDTAYILDGAAINKDALVGGTWVSEGSDAVAGGKFSQIAAEPDASGTGVDLFVSNNLAAGAVVQEITDSAAFNATGVFSAPTTLYTAPTGDLLRGISLAPVPEPASFSLLAIGGISLLARRRRSVVQ